LNDKKGVRIKWWGKQEGFQFERDVWTYDKIVD
jgi:hypothetical protein